MIWWLLGPALYLLVLAGALVLARSAAPDNPVDRAVEDTRQDEYLKAQQVERMLGF